MFSTRRCCMKGLGPWFSAVVIFIYFHFSCLFKCTVLLHNSIIFLLYYVLYQSICSSTWIYLELSLHCWLQLSHWSCREQEQQVFKRGTKKPNPVKCLLRNTWAWPGTDELLTDRCIYGPLDLCKENFTLNLCKT